MRVLEPSFAAYEWAPSTAEVARRSGRDPVEILRFDANVRVAPLASSRPGALAGAVADINTYPHGGYPDLVRAIADYAGVGPENVVLGAGADDLILLCARSFAGPGDRVAIAQDPTYPLYRIASQIAGARIDNDSPVLTFCCRPNNPTGELGELPEARPLVVDEAYFEYAGATAVDSIDDGVVVLRTFSKAFGLAGARIGYALAARDVAADLNRRQAPAPLSTLSAALATAALGAPPDVAPEVAERERVAAALRSLGLSPLPSRANFLMIPLVDPVALHEALVDHGIVVRIVPGGVRISVRDRADDDVLLEAVARILDGGVFERSTETRRTRHMRATAETCMRVRLTIEGTGLVRVATGAGLYDHLLEQLAFHAGFDLILEGTGDLETGPHHTVEDAAIALGESLDRAIGDRRGIARYGDAAVPMDDALARAAVDVGGRSWSDLRLERDPGLAAHALGSLARAGRFALHVDAIGADEHHVAEAAFKATGRALRQALAPSGDAVPSTKGLL